MPHIQLTIIQTSNKFIHTYIHHSHIHYIQPTRHHNNQETTPILMHKKDGIYCRWIINCIFNIFDNESFRLTKSNLIIMLLKELRLIAFTLLIIKAFAVSTLTTNNCPQDYDINALNTTDSSYSQSTIKLIYGGIYSQSDQAKLTVAFTVGDTDTVESYITSMSNLTPFIIIAIAFAITFIISLCCCVFQKTCPPCQSWKRDFAVNPYEKFQLKCTFLFAVGFALSIAVVSVVGLAYYPLMQTEMDSIKCSLYYSIDVAMNGDTDNNWGGFTLLSTQVSNISSQITTAGTSVTSNFGTSNTLLSGLAALRQKNINLYNSNYQSTVFSPNHITTNTSINTNAPLPTVTPLFISSGLGPYTQNNTMTYQIQTGLNQTEQVTNQAYQVFTYAQLLTNSIANIQAKFTSSVQKMTANSLHLNKALDSIQSFTERVIHRTFTRTLYLIQGVLVFTLMGSILIMLGVVATYYFQIYGCKACVHLGWIIYGLMYFGVLALCFIFFSIGGVSYTFCQFYSGLVNNKILLNSFTSSTKQTSFNQIFSTLSPCFYGNGSISQSFSTTSQTQTLNTLYTQINTYLNMLDSSKSTYINLNSSIDQINGWIAAMEQYRAGIYVDAPTSVVTQDNPYVALQNMNKYSQNQSGGSVPICTYDYWVFDKTNCTLNSTQSIYQSSSTTSGTTFVTTGSLCISLNQKFSSSSTQIWSLSDITNRYVNRRQCKNNTKAFQQLISYATSIINYRDSRINLYQNLKDQLNSLLDANNNYNAYISAFTANVTAFNANTSSLNSLMTNSINGVNYASNCTIVANSLRFFYNVFCINFVYKSVQFGICCIILMGIMIGGMITGSVFGVRYNRIEKDPKVYLKQPSITLQQQMSSSNKRRDSSDTSSSDDQD